MKDVLPMNVKDVLPMNGYLLCRCITSKMKTTDTGFQYESDDLLQYEIVKMGQAKDSESLKLSPHDIVIVNSTGTKIYINGEEMFIFNISNVMGKVIS